MTSEFVKVNLKKLKNYNKNDFFLKFIGLITSYKFSDIIIFKKLMSEIKNQQFQFFITNILNRKKT